MESRLQAKNRKAAYSSLPTILQDALKGNSITTASRNPDLLEATAAVPADHSSQERYSCSPHTARRSPCVSHGIAPARCDVLPHGKQGIAGARSSALFSEKFLLSNREHKLVHNRDIAGLVRKAHFLTPSQVEKIGHSLALLDPRAGCLAEEPGLRAAGPRSPKLRRQQ